MFNHKKEFVISRSQIVDELNRFAEKECSGSKYSVADLDFMKETLLPIKAKLTQAIQNYNPKNDTCMNDHVLESANKCFEYLQKGDLSLAYCNFSYFFKFGSHTVCSYSELVTGLLLINALLDTCNRRIQQYSELQKRSRSAPGKEAFTEILNETDEKRALNRLEFELEWWRDRQYYSLPEYFGLSDEEYYFLGKSCLKTFKTIGKGRRKGVDINSGEQSENFIERVIQGTALISDIDDQVEFWHTHMTGDSLEDYLGLTGEEFELWVKSGDDILNDIVYCRRSNLAISEYIQEKGNQ